MDGENKFIADVHLGKLARLLRLVGFDTLYTNSYSLIEFLAISTEQNRILLSRNSALSIKAGTKCFLITHEDPFEQLKQVILHFNLNGQFRPFSRCMVCNGILEIVDKETIVHLLQQNTLNYFNAFWQCSNCNRVYWKGSHYERMLKTIEKISSEPFEFSLASKKHFMSTKEIAARLMELCRQGKWEEAQKELFAEDAVSIEPHSSPAFEQQTKGLNAIIEKGKKFETMVEKNHRTEVGEPIITANAIAFKLIMEVTMKGRSKETWEEICVYQVKDGKIISEQFFL
jgi:uncharacterized protein with PIN domain